MVEYIIIDSNAQYRKIYKEIIDKVMFKNNIIYQIGEYKKIDCNLGKEISKNCNYKIYLVDINNKTQKVITNVVKNIRRYDLYSEIIFLYSSDMILDTIYKSVRKIYCSIEKIQGMCDVLKKELTNIVNHYLHNNKFFLLDKKGNLKISLNSILYIYRETTERKLYVVTENNRYPLNLTITEALEKCDNSFKQIHRACIVNTRKIDVYNWNEHYFVLENNNKVFMCSKKYKDNFD